jgi:hypothetical protein
MYQLQATVAMEQSQMPTDEVRNYRNCSSRTFYVDLYRAHKVFIEELPYKHQCGGPASEVPEDRENAGLPKKNNLRNTTTQQNWKQEE